MRLVRCDNMQKKAQIMIHTKPKPAEKPKQSRATKPKTSTNARTKPEKSISEDPIIIDISAFSISPVINSAGIHVITRCLGEPVNVCTLASNAYQAWIRSSPQERFQYVFQRTNITDAKIKSMIITRTIEINNSILRAR